MALAAANLDRNKYVTVMYHRPLEVMYRFPAFLHKLLIAGLLDSDFDRLNHSCKVSA